MGFDHHSNPALHGLHDDLCKVNLRIRMQVKFWLLDINKLIPSSRMQGDHNGQNLRRPQSNVRKADQVLCPALAGLLEPPDLQFQRNVRSANDRDLPCHAEFLQVLVQLLHLPRKRLPTLNNACHVPIESSRKRVSNRGARLGTPKRAAHAGHVDDARNRLSNTTRNILNPCFTTPRKLTPEQEANATNFLPSPPSRRRDRRRAALCPLPRHLIKAQPIAAATQFQFKPMILGCTQPKRKRPARADSEQLI